MLEIFRTRRIFCLLLVMLATIDLNSEHSLKADKIDDVVTKMVLPAKFEARYLPSSQGAPQTLLGVSHIATQPPLQLGAQNILVGLAFH